MKRVLEEREMGLSSVTKRAEALISQKANVEKELFRQRCREAEAREEKNAG